MVANSTIEIHPAAVNVDEVPSFTTIYGFIVVQAARLVHKCNNEPYIDIMISRTQKTTILKGIYGRKPYDDRLAHSDLAQQKISEKSSMSMAFVMNQNGTSCSWSEWLDLQIEQLENVHGPIVKENV